MWRVHACSDRAERGCRRCWAVLSRRDAMSGSVAHWAAQLPVANAGSPPPHSGSPGRPAHRNWALGFLKHYPRAPIGVHAMGQAAAVQPCERAVRCAWARGALEDRRRRPICRKAIYRCRRCLPRACRRLLKSGTSRTIAFSEPLQPQLPDLQGQSPSSQETRHGQTLTQPSPAWQLQKQLGCC